jgi:hypothetical protein
LDKAAQTLQEEIASYPRSCSAHGDLANVNAMQGQYEQAAENVRQCLPGIEDPVFAYGNLAGRTDGEQSFSWFSLTSSRVPGSRRATSTPKL